MTFVGSGRFFWASIKGIQVQEVKTWPGNIYVRCSGCLKFTPKLLPPLSGTSKAFLGCEVGKKSRSFVVEEFRATEARMEIPLRLVSGGGKLVSKSKLGRLEHPWRFPKGSQSSVRAPVLNFGTLKSLAMGEAASALRRSLFPKAASFPFSQSTCTGGR